MVRGIVNFVEALIFGYKCLMESAEKREWTSRKRKICQSSTDG